MVRRKSRCLFNLAIDWELFHDLTPVRKVKFFQELNTGRRILSPEEQEELLQNAVPYLQDLILFDLNTGCGQVNFSF